MKKINLITSGVIILGVALIIAVGLSFRNSVVLKFGGTKVITVVPGEEVIGVIYREGSIHYLSKPMDDYYEPSVKYLREVSPNGILNSTFEFHEQRRD